MIFCGIVFGLILLLRLCPDLPISRALHKLLVTHPLESMSKISRIEVVAVFIVIALLMAGGEVIAALGSVDFVLAYAMQTALYLDFVVISTAVVVARYAKVAFRQISTRISIGLGIKPKTRHRRPKSIARTNRPSNDDEDAAFLALAAA